MNHEFKVVMTKKNMLIEYIKHINHFNVVGICFYYHHILRNAHLRYDFIGIVNHHFLNSLYLFNMTTKISNGDCILSHHSFFMPPPLGAGGIMFSGCPSVRPSVRPKPEIPSFDLYIGPLVHPTNRYRFTAWPSVRPSVRPSVCPSVRPERFPGICRRLHGGISLKFYMLMYLDHLQNW